MGIPSSNNITTKDLDRVLVVLTNLESVLKKMNDTLKHKEQIMLEEEAVKSSSIAQGLSNAIIILPDSLGSSSCFSNALALFPEKKKPTLIQKKDLSESKDTCSKIIHLVSSRLKKMDRKPTLIVNLQLIDLLPVLDSQMTIIIGKRFYQDNTQILNELMEKIRSYNFQVIEDTGLFGGGALTYGLSTSFKEITVVEITLPKKIAENGTNMRRFLGALSQ